MVVISQRDETEGLQNALRGSNWNEHLRHAVYRTGLGLEGDFDEVALFQIPGQTQQAAGYRDGLKFAFGALSVFEHDQSGN